MAKSPWDGISPAERKRRVAKMQASRAANREARDRLPGAKQAGHTPHNGPPPGAKVESFSIDASPPGADYSSLAALIVAVWRAL